MVTKGEPYLKVPETEMSFISHDSVAGYAAFAACSFLFAKALTHIISYVFYAPHKPHLSL